MFMHGSTCKSFELLLELLEQVGIEKLCDRDPQAVTELLDRGHRRAVVASADDIVHGGLGDAALDAEGIDGNIAGPAELNDPLPHRLSDSNGASPLSPRSAKKEYTIPLAKLTPFELK